MDVMMLRRLPFVVRIPPAPKLRFAGLLLALGLLATGTTGAQTALDTGDGLRVTFDDATGSITGVTVDETPLALVPGAAGGVGLRVGTPVSPTELLLLDFAADGGPWTTARNANWDGAGPYATWSATEGGHLLLGTGATTGAGMAMAAPVAVIGGAQVRIRWRARTADTATLQILCVRVYDAAGNDITASVPTPTGWGWTSTSQAHGLWGLHCATPDTWEPFEYVYPVPLAAAAVRVSLRYWNGGDGWVHIDDLQLDATGGIGWTDVLAPSGALVPTTEGFAQVATLPGQALQIETHAGAARGALWFDLAVQDLSGIAADRPVVLSWALPIAAQDWTWWDDLDTARWVTPGSDETLSSTFLVARHAVSFYPLATITGPNAGVALAVPLGGPVAHRLEYDPRRGLQSVWEVGLSPATTKLGAGRAAVSFVLYQHAPDAGLRAALQRYYALFPGDFVRRTERTGAWMYPILPSQIPNPLDFGFRWLETWSLSQAERDLCAQLGIDIFYYSEPWLAWQPWGTDPNKPSYAERVARLEAWASGTSGIAEWQSDGGVSGSGHVLLGDGMTVGAGLATPNAFPVPAGQTVALTWQARAASTATTQIVGLRLYDADGNDITPTTPAPPGWFWSGASQAHVALGFAVATPDEWQPFAINYALPVNVSTARVALRYYNGGDPYVHADELRVAAGGGAEYLHLTFDADDGSWVAAYASDWDDADPKWLRVPRSLSAQAILSASPTDAAGLYLIDADNYFWHEWSPGTWNQAWPLNQDPDLASPNAYELYHDHWVFYQIEHTSGAYIDSVTATYGVGGWENRRPEHLAVSDTPLTFSWADGGAAQLGPQSHNEFLAPIAAEVRAGGRLMMLNLFPEALRFHAQHADVQGSEVSQLVEPGYKSRLRRALAYQRNVSNLLQWGWGSLDYATKDQMEQFIRGQLFWGFFPAVSSAGGPLNGGTPDRYFLHPELYERDRPLFQQYMPVITLLAQAGWEPVTGATALPASEHERFGAFARGPVYLTLRSADGAPLTTAVTVDLPPCGLNSTWVLVGRDVLADAPVALTSLADPPRVRFDTALAAGEVKVLELTPVPVPNGDFDGDGAVTVADLPMLLFCMIGPEVKFAPGQGCLRGDLDTDRDVDLADLAAWQRRVVVVP